MKICDILKRCKEIKSERKFTYSNYYNKYNASDIDFDVIEGKGTIVWGLKEEFVYRIYFCTNSLCTLKECLKEVKKNAVIDWVFKEEAGEIGQVIEESGWEKYGEYVRTMLPIPNNKKKKTKIEVLLEKMYNPELGQVAQEEDIPAIRKLMIDIFDPINSEIMEEEELRRLIKEETVWLHKIDDTITTCYIYRIEGKKRYGAMTYNCLGADYLYSITRRANEISNKIHKPKWHYGWINISNKKIIRSLKETNDLNPDGVRNIIYKKK